MAGLARPERADFLLRCEGCSPGKHFDPASTSTSSSPTKRIGSPSWRPTKTITRKLIFAYPRNRSPTRLACLPMVILLPQF